MTIPSAASSFIDLCRALVWALDQPITNRHAKLVLDHTLLQWKLRWPTESPTTFAFVNSLRQLLGDPQCSAANAPPSSPSPTSTIATSPKTP